MYCATSFCERENSSKRARMYVERVWCLGAPEGGLAVLEARFIGGPVFRRPGAAFLPRTRFRDMSAPRREE